MMGSYITLCSVHTTLGQGQVQGPIVFYYIPPVPCPCPVPEFCHSNYETEHVILVNNATGFSVGEAPALQLEPT